MKRNNFILLLCIYIYSCWSNWYSKNV